MAVDAHRDGTEFAFHQGSPETQVEALTRAVELYGQAISKLREADEIGHAGVSERVLAQVEANRTRAAADLDRAQAPLRERAELRGVEAREEQKELEVALAKCAAIADSEFRSGEDWKWDELSRGIDTVARLQPGHGRLTVLRQRLSEIEAASVASLSSSARDHLMAGRTREAWRDAATAAARPTGQQCEEVVKVLAEVRKRCDQNLALVSDVGMARWYYTPPERSGPVSAMEYFIDPDTHRSTVVEFSNFAIIEEVEPDVYLGHLMDSRTCFLVISPRRDVLREQHRMGGLAVEFLARFVEKRRVISAALPNLPQVVPVFQLLH